MKKELSEFFTNKLVIIISLFLIFGSVSVIAGNVFVNEHGIKSYNYYSKRGALGLTQNISYMGADGNDYTLVVENGLIVNTTAQTEPEQNNSENSSFPTEGLISYYKLDDTDNINAIDELGTNDGTQKNDVIDNIAGKLGTAFSFDGSDAYVSLGDASATFEGISETTISMWINFDSVSVRQELFDSSNHFNQGDTTCAYILLNTGLLIFQCYGDSAMNIGSVNYNPDFSPGSWHFLTGTINSTHINLYVDGTKVANNLKNNNITIQNTSHELCIGKYGTGNDNEVYGDIDEVGIWNRALTPEEVSVLYNNGEGLTYPN